MKKSTFILVLIFFIITSASAQKTDKENENAVSPSTVSLETLIQKQSPTYVITKEHVSRTSGIRHVYLRQAINGLEVYGTESSIHIDENGKVISSKSNFIKDIEVTLKRTTQSLSSDQAIDAVARQMGYTISDIQLLKTEEEVSKKAVYNKAGISSEDIPVKLMYYYREGEGTILVWELSIAELETSDWWNFRVDAGNGKIIDKTNWKRECNVLGEHSHDSDVIEFEKVDYITSDASATYAAYFNAADGIGTYNVYPMPVESPSYGTRSLVVGPANATASPFGWHDTDGAIGAEFTNTRGNNVSAWDDNDANDAPDGAYTDSPGGDLVFDFTLNTTYSGGDQSTDAATTNLFYWNNIIHDVLYQYGFDEASGNFQENNYGNGGSDGDSVNALAQSGLGTCNANFWTPVDGSNGRMRMYTCGSRDGDLDNWVIVHEYGHGISIRLTGGAADSDCLDNNEQMGEGWADFYGLMLTMQSTDAAADIRGFGTWGLSGEGAGGAGVRNFPYSTDMTINPQTYDSIKTTNGPWPLGEVWATMLWDLTWGLIDEYGFDTNFYNFTGDVNQDAGNIMALALVTEGLKLQNCSPGFVDGRDAIIAADAAIYGGANECLIWKAFSRRGLGQGANQASSDSRIDGTEAFDSPYDAPEALCVADFAIALDVNGEVNLTVADIDNGSSVSCGSYSLNIAPKFFTCADLGPNVVTLTLTDLYGDEYTCTTTVTVDKHPTTLTYTGDLEEQYSDETDLSALLVDQGGNGLAGETILFTIGTQSTSGVTDANGIATATIILTQDPTPAYTVDIEFEEVACYAGSTDSDVFDITQEDAIVEYTGHLFQATAPNSTIATVELSANIQDITVTNPDPLAGDIRNATVKFVDRDGGDISPWIPVVDLFDPSDPTTGTVSWDWDVDLGNLTSKSTTVGIVVGSYYTRNASEDNVVVTVYRPVGDFITGGGYILPDNSAGSYASTDGLKTNFGYNVKYNKKGKKLRGNMNIIFRRMEGDGIHTYQIKGNAILSLGVNIADASAKFGEFITKANLKDITDPENPISIAGNLRLKVDMTDRGEPGVDDSIGINLTTVNGILLYSSNWSGLNTNEMMLSGGNLVVHSGFSISRFIDVFEVVSWPNPSDSFFNLKINTNSLEKVKVTVFDINNRLVSQSEFDPKQNHQFGNQLQSGSYFIQVRQGERETVLRLIKH